MDVFGGAPRFLAYPRAVGVQTGTDAVLKCQISGDPRPAVIWERNNEKVHPGGRYRVFEDGNIYNLIITGVTTEDSGQYICKAKNCIGETYAAATLKVEGEAQEMELREENKPRFLIKPLSTRVGRGEDAVFSCKLWGNPRPEVVWEKDGRKLNEIFESTHFSVGYQDGGWYQLKIFKTRAPDGGVYTCKARNEFGESLAGAVLLVDAGPGHEDEGNRNGYTNGHWKSNQGKQRRQVATRLKEDPQPNSAKVKMFAVTEGKHAKFRCFVTGKPKPEIIWRKDGRLIMSGRRYLLYEDREGYFTLKVLYCKQQDNGVYVCAASNTAGQTLSAVHLSVKEPPVRFKQPLNDLQVWERDLAVLECEVPEDSIPITWYLEDRRLQPGAKYGMEEWGTKRRLTIRDIGVDDDGIYLCEMADGGRSIAEVAVKGTIVRKLPRKVDVLEGENAAFCVEVEEEEMEIHWYKDGTELRETHQTILKSFGKTHILVFVNTTPQDSGLVTFYVGRSKTSSQLRVKGARHCPPSCPVGVQINTERANAALLSWIPAPDSRKNPPSGYVLERQEVGSQEWLQCLTTDSATSVEILGDSVPCEADYRFRICSVNKYGRSDNVEFPRSVHLVPVARIQTPLQDALVPEGQDALFSIELSASVIGTWFLNGNQLQEEDRFSMRRTRTHQSLRIRGVRDTDNGAEITFIAYGIRDSAALYIQAPLVKFTPLSEMDRNKFVEVGNPIVLYCELSNPEAPVHWYKNGVELHTVEGLHIQSEGTMRRIVIQSADFSHSGVYSCDAIDDVIRFNVEVEAPPVRFSVLPETEKSKSIEAGCPFELQCELSDSAAQVFWYKDGTKILQQSDMDFQSNGTQRTLVVQSAEFCHSGIYSCKTKGDAVHFKVDVKAKPVRFSAVPEDEKNKYLKEGQSFQLQCEVTDPSAEVCWYKDGEVLIPEAGLDFQPDCALRRLIVHSAQPCHSGVYVCKTMDDSVQFTVEIKAQPMRFSALQEITKDIIEGNCQTDVPCEISDPTAMVCWYKDEAELISKSERHVNAEATRRTLSVPSTQPYSSGVHDYMNEADVVQLNIQEQALPMEYEAVSEVEKIEGIEPGIPTAELCEVSGPAAQVCSHKTGTELVTQGGTQVPSEGGVRKVNVQSTGLSQHGIRTSSRTNDAVPNKTSKAAEPFHSDVYSEISGDSVQSTVDKKAPAAGPVSVRAVQEIAENQSVEERCTSKIQCGISEPIAQLNEHRDGAPQQQTLIETQRVQSEDLCLLRGFEKDNDVGDEAITIKVDVKAPSMDPTAPCEVENNKSIEAYSSKVQHHKTIDSSAEVSIYQEGELLLHPRGIYSQSDGPMEKLVVKPSSASPADVCRCETEEHSVQWHEDQKASQVKCSALPVIKREKSIEAGCPFELQCEISNPSAPVCWYKDGLPLLPQNGLSIQSEDSSRSLVVPSADLFHSGVYSCNSEDDVIIFKVDVKAPPPPKFSTIPEAEKHKSTEAGSLAVLQCERSDPAKEVCYKDGARLHPKSGNIILSEGTLRTLVQSAGLSHSGEFAYETKDNALKVAGDLKAPPVKFSTVPEDERNPCVEVGGPVELKCEISDPTTDVSWCKDGVPLKPQGGIKVQSEGATRKLSICAAELSHAGIYNCKTADDAIHFKVDIKAPCPRFTPLPEVERNKYYTVGQQIILKCEISDPSAQVCWYRNGKQLFQKNKLDIQSKGKERILVNSSAAVADSGQYVCAAADDAITFKVDIRAAPVRFSVLPDVAKNKFVEARCPIVLQCEVSNPGAPVSWFKDGVQLLQQGGFDFQTNGTIRALTIQSAELSHSGVYSCETVDDHIEFKVDVAAPPVTFLHIPEEDLHKNVVEHDTLLLSCELSRADVLAQWYKDGVELQPNENTAIQMENTVHTVKIKSSQLSDSGIYTCRAGDSALMFKVNVREPPAMIVYPKEDVHLDRYVPEEIVLSCELSRPNGSVNWYKDGQKLQESENIKLKLEGPYRRLKILKSATEDSGEYVCDTAVDSRFFHLNVTEPPVRIMSPSQSQMELCQQTSERMVLSCELSRANAVVRWYRDGLEVEENDRLLLEVDGIYRRLIIPETDVKDSAEYVCDTMDESVTFFVNIAEPPVRFIRPRKMASGVEASVGETVVLDCEVSRANAEVCWRKNGEEIEESANITITEDGLVRQLTIHSSSLEDTGQYICDARDDVMDFQVKISEPPLKILRTSDTVTNKHFVVPEDIVLKCELSRPNGTVEWYKNDEWLVENERISCESDGQFRSLIILNAEAPDAGEYVCDAKDDTIKFCVIVEEPPVTILGNAEKPEHHSLVAGDDLILECEVSRSNAPVAWYRNGQLLRANSRTHIESQGTVRKLVLSGLELSDSGEYVCNATEDKMLILVTVQEAPVKFNDKEEGSKAVAYEDESVTLCAKVNRENACVRWLKDKEEIIGNRYRKRSEGKSHYLTIEALKESDSGKYTCDAKNDEMHFLVLVKAMKVKFSKPLKNAVALKDSDLLLLCELQKPKGDVQWLKDDKEVTPSRHYIIRANGCERSLTIHNVTAEDAGVYACESKDERTYATVEVQTPRVVEFVAELHNVTVMEGEDATFKCVVSPEDAKLDWCINGKLVAPDQKFNISSTGLCHMLHIHNCQVTDSAKVTAEAEGLISKANLHVQEAQVVFIKGMETVEAEEFGEATLEVKLSSDSGEVQWMRQGMVIKPGPKFTLKQRGATRSLTIHRLALSDRGTYSCETLHDRTQAKLCVEPRKIKIRKGLSDGQTFERETASFEVELSHNNVEAAWLKDGVRLRNNNHWRLSVKGRVHSLTISNLSLEDSGTYVFSAESARTSARLTVKETPVSIMKKLEDVRFPEGSGATVECELSRHNVEVKWMKNGVELKPDKNHRIYSMGRKRLLQILKCEMEDTGIYTCSAGETSTACSVDVYEPEVEVLQPLEDLEVQEDENAVFMCELSLESVPGEWFKNGERIKPTSTIKIRQEGSKHFLLMCNVKGEDGGEIKFVAKNTESIAYLEVEELPVSIVNPLQDKTALEKSRVLLDCSVSNPRCSIRWYKGSNVILPSERFEICSEGCYRKLVIQQVNLEDEGTYSVQVGDYTSSAKLTVEAQSLLMVRDLQDVEVVSPEEACFECEVTVPVLKAPVWTLNGETLQPGSRVLLEKMGKVHRLTLRQTSEDMNGVVQFTSGKAKSSAKLCVKSSL
ncbi:obscurin-like protein 1 isoform X3 [Denticeps clupeoides]|uniref:obscurin-like protein 1 isoform X3 n=1 Tax=Denticeps clupeoides TaxID=299321 RepID=UPI0010A3E9FE|nr:obscurin-like protein 1 isoform X3 [Denticeps clupeoides]